MERIFFYGFPQEAVIAIFTGISDIHYSFYVMSTLMAYTCIHTYTRKNAVNLDNTSI